MDRRIKVWLTVLIVLLVAAIAGVVVINVQLSGSKTALEAANMQLSSEIEKNETLTADYESISTQLTETQESSAAYETQLAEMQDKLAETQAKLSEAEEKLNTLEIEMQAGEPAQESIEAGEPTDAVEVYDAEAPQPDTMSADASDENVGQLETDLESAQQNVDALNAAIQEGNDTIAQLQAQLETLNAESESNSAEAQAQIDALKAEIDAEQQKMDALTADLAAANGQLEKLKAELKAYKLERDLTAGEAHTAATLEGVLQVGADGKSVVWAYSNNSTSGNAVVLRIELDGETIYTSEALQPDEQLTAFELEHALESGNYDAEAIASVYDTDGSLISSTRIPVKIQVG